MNAAEFDPMSSRKDIHATLIALEELLGSIKKDLHNIKKTVLADQKEMQRSAVPQIPPGLDLPISSLAHFQRLEKQLETSTETKENLILFLAERGGTTLREFTRRVMGFLMQNQVALLFNMTGQRGKVAFKTSELFDVVYNASKSNPKTESFNKRDVELSVRWWFVGARDRGGGREARKRQSVQPLRKNNIGSHD